MKKYIEKQFESGEVYIESTSHGHPIWWREFKEIVNEANTLSDINSCLMDSKTPFRLLPMLVNNISVFNPFIFDFLTNNPNYLQCFYDGHIKGKKEFEETYFIKYPNEQQTKVITRKFNDDFKKTILFGQGFFNESNVTMAGFQNGILTAYWLFENSFLENKNQQTQQTEKPKPELTINQIALKYVYSEIQITRENGNKIAKEYGHNSGEKLFQRFTYYSSAANRKGKPTPCTPKKLDNKIKLIESIIELLPTDKQERAKDEVSILKKIYEAEYQ